VLALEMQMITNEQLRAAFVSPAMKFYFDRKLAPLAGAEVDARVEELLKYLNMATHSHGGIPFNDDIDDVWHLWIMQTKEYAALCRKLQGARFIHHSSNEYEAFADPDVKTRPMDTQRAVGVLRSYVMNYGPFGADRVCYWPVAEQLVQRLGWTVQRLNEWLAQPVHRAAPAPQAVAV
jgi:hypothetical protein